jgi:Ca2+/Na+ antiporter
MTNPFEAPTAVADAPAKTSSKLSKIQRLALRGLFLGAFLGLILGAVTVLAMHYYTSDAQSVRHILGVSSATTVWLVFSVGPIVVGGLLGAISYSIVAVTRN